MSYDHLKRSAIATGCAELITLPLCTLKTVYQNTQSNSITQTARQLYRNGGIAAFYNASLPALGSQIFSTSSKYVLYRHLEKHQYTSQIPIIQNWSFTQKMANGLAAGILSSLFTHPIDAIKIHWQMQEKFLPKLKQEGFGLFYRGYSKTFSKILLSSSLFFPLYDFFYDQSHQNALLASFGSGFTSTLIMHPVDYLKTRHIYGLPLYQGWDPRIYYKGLTINLMRIVPHFMIVMTGINYLNQKGW